MTDLRRVFDRAVLAAEERSYLHATIGRVNPDGSVSMRVPGKPNFLYVTIDGRGVSIARNTGVPRRAHLPVRVREENGVLVIHGVDHSGGRLDVFLGEGGLSPVNYHTHRVGSGLEYVVQPQLMEPGLVQPNSGMTVYINAFRYFAGDSWDTWEGGTIDLTPYQPATAGTWAWVLVGIDPATNSAVAQASGETPITTPLAWADLDAISFEGYIPCGAVKVRADDTALTDIARFFDARGWLNLGGGGTTIESLDDIDDVNAPSPADGDVLTYDADAGVWIAAKGGGAAYAETIGDGVETTFAVTHDLNTTDVLVQLWDLTGTDPLLATGDAQSIEATDADTVTVTFDAAPDTDAYRVVVLASGGTGSGALSDLADVDVTGLSDDDILQYDAGSATWQPAPPPSAPAYITDWSYRSNNRSSSTFAWKGNEFTPDLDVELAAIAYYGGLVAGATYQAAVVTGDGSPGNVATIVKSAPVTLPNPLASTGGGWVWLHFDPPQVLSAGTTYGLLVGRTDDADDYALPLAYNGGTTAENAVPMTGASHGRTWRIAKANPQVGDAIDLLTTQSIGAGYMFRY